MPGIDTPQQFVHPLFNGLTLVAERMPAVQSAALTFLVPAGAASDPVEASGAASVLSDWILRGAGERDSKQLTDYLDSLGVQRGAQADTVFLRFSASMLAKNLAAVLPVYGQIVREPHLPEDGFEPALDLALQQLDAIEDEPSHKLSLLMRERFYGFPLGRPSAGVREQLADLTAERLQDDFAIRVQPRGAILSVAGAFEWERLKAAVEAAFARWKPRDHKPLKPVPPPDGMFHVSQETNQVQIGLGYSAPPEHDPESILLQTGIMVLSGGMGSRLFSEIREKQGLCYSVQAGYQSFKNLAGVFGYAGTAPDRAQQTLNAFLHELRRLAQGVSPDEFERAKIGMKSRIIMQGESSAARAAALAHDFYHRSHPRTLEDLRREIESLTLDRLNEYLANHPPGKLTVVTIGPSPLQLHPEI